MPKALVILIALCSTMMALAATPNPAPFERPLVFEPNLGQSPAQVFWTARGGGYQLYLTSTGASIVLAEPLGEFAAAAPASFPGKPGTQLSALPKARVSVIGMTLAGSHSWSSVEGLEPTGGVSNYLIGNRKDWRSGIPQYARVRVKGVYDGIDLVFYGHGRDLEYDFVVAPGADPNQIRLAFDGAGPMRVDSKTGDLMIKTKTGGEMRHVRPGSFSRSATAKLRSPVDTRF